MARENVTPPKVRPKSLARIRKALKSVSTVKTAPEPGPLQHGLDKSDQAIHSQIAIECPVCGGVAERGNLYGSQRECLKWLPESKPLFLGTFVIGALNVGRYGIRFPNGRSRVQAIRCLRCKRIIIDPDQIGMERVHFRLMTLFHLTTTLAGGFAGAVAVSQWIDVVAGAFFGFPLGCAIGWLIGVCIARSLEHVLDSK